MTRWQKRLNWAIMLLLWAGAFLLLTGHYKSGSTFLIPAVGGMAYLTYRANRDMKQIIAEAERLRNNGPAPE